MKPKHLEQLLTLFLTEKIDLSLCLWGTTGIGKSTLPRKVAHNNGYHVFDIRLSQVESVDVKGMPWTQYMTVELSKNEIIKELSKIKHFKRKSQKLATYLNIDPSDITKDNFNKKLDSLEDYYDEKIGVLHHYSPDWFIKALTEGKCIIFLDELNRAKPDVLQAIFELILSKTLNNLQLGPDVMILAACNPPTSSYEVTDISNESALKARMLHLKIDSDIEHWMSWGTQYIDDAKSKTKIHPNVLGFLSTSPKLLDVKDNNEDQADLETWIGPILPKPRKWEMVSQLEELEDKFLNIQIPNDENAGKSIFNECIMGLIGRDTGITYIKTRLSSDKPITLKEFVAWDEETQEKCKNICGIKSENKKRKRTDVQSTESSDDFIIKNDLIFRLLSDIKENLAYTIENNPKAVAEFLTMIPKDMSLSFFKNLVTLSKKIEYNVVLHESEKGITNELFKKLNDELEKNEASKKLLEFATKRE